DNFLSHKYKVDKTDLMPWHYQDRFFQHAPKIHKVDLDKYYLDQNIEVITKNYFNGIGLEIDDLLERSDLYEKEGKYQHAYCTNIDKSGDVRVVCNIKPNHDWMGTMLHEFGHAVYDKYVNDRLPWILREHSHIFTTEAIAMIFGRFASSPQWIDDMIGIGDDEKNEIADECKKSARLEQFVFARWVLVIYNFEKEMYRNPDQDLNALWWEKVEKFQFLKRPIGRNKADWASKIHLALYPAYYHNYLLGEMLASQLYYFISEKVLGKSFKDDLSFAGNKKVGDYLKMLFFNYGALYRWDELVNKSTGEDLNPKYYAEQFFH
ncbi:MAG: M2 family metallopeptidase, partial [Melioribacteraceae bacterium]|nr:M2 family metallopeptidase [Melioribacteraceae bacterium]